MTEFNELGVVVGNKLVATLDENGKIIDTSSVKEDETDENIEFFARQTPEYFSHILITDLKYLNGWTFNGSEWVEPVAPEFDIKDYITDN
jgi:hypothetical protein